VAVAKRVKSTLGRVTAHQRAISVSAADQCVTLTGDALASEIGSIVSAVQHVRGVVSVQNNIRTHATAEGVPILRGGWRRRAQLMRAWLSASSSTIALLAAGAAVAFGAAALLRGGADALPGARMTD
jgi:hypothetical protein